MASDLAQLAAELRAARGDLAGELPHRGPDIEDYPYEAWLSPEGDCIEDKTARRILIGVCAEVLMEAGSADIFRHNHTKTYVWNNFDEHGDYVVQPNQDFLTILVRATIAVKLEENG